MSVAAAPTKQGEGEEFARCFSIKARGILSYRSDGRILIKGVGDADFKPYRLKKPDIPLEEWLSLKRQQLLSVERWCFEVTELPSMDELEEWVLDSVVETPTGHSVEPDGCGPDGVPSWLRCLGLI